MDTQEKLTAIIGSLVDTLHEGMERTDGNIPPAMLTALSTSIGSLAQAKANLVAIDIHREAQASVEQSANRSLVTLEGEATGPKPPPFPERWTRVTGAGRTPTEDELLAALSSDPTAYGLAADTCGNWFLMHERGQTGPERG